MKTSTLTALLLSASLAVSAQTRDDPFDTAKSLYQSASYEAALTALDKVPAGEARDQVDKYRALCLLGLNRSQEAEQTIDHLVTRRPLFKADALDSPKLTEMIADARKRILPTAAASLYEAAKQAFDHGDLATAGEQFATVVTLLSQPEAAAQPATADLKVLAGGFARLVEQKLTLQRQEAAAAAAAAAQAAPSASASSAPDRIYGAQDSDVVPPVPVDQSIPQWVPPDGVFGSRTFSGTIEIVVDEDGAVSSATVAQSALPTYDHVLVEAARKWRYRPASRGGQPVKYRKLIHVTLMPPPAGSGR